MSLDPVTQEVLSHAFAGIAEEMAVVEYRSSFSPIIREMLDFSCGLFDAEGRMVAHSEMIPAQLGLMQFALAAVGRHGRLAPGDVVLINHPYHGGTHTPDLQLFAPAYEGVRSSGTPARSPTTSTSAAAFPVPRARSARSSTRRGCSSRR